MAERFSSRIYEYISCFFFSDGENSSFLSKQKRTPPKFNMEPENDGFQRESPFPGTSVQVPC